MEKICFVLSNYFKYYMGGAELQAYFIAKQLSESVEIHYLFMNHPNFNRMKFQKIDHGIVLHPMKKHAYKAFGKFFFMNYWEFLRLLDDINPDLIYQRGGKPYIGMAASWCKRNKKKSVLGISMDTNCRRDGILDLSHNFFQYPSKIINGFFTFVGIENADLIIAQNNNQQRLLRQNFKTDSLLIPNGLPVPAPPFKKADPPIISWVANIKYLKQPEIFIRLAEKLKDLNAKFVYAGRPSERGYQKMLMEKTKKLLNLNYLGEIPFEKTNELLSKSLLFVNTSLTEGFSNTYIQAWMRETPVLALNCDPDNIIKSHKLGFHSGSFGQLVKDVRYLIEHEHIARKMGRKAREFAIKNHDIEKIGKKYFEFFKRVVDE